MHKLKNVVLLDSNFEGDTIIYMHVYFLRIFHNISGNINLNHLNIFICLLKNFRSFKKIFIHI